MYCADWKTLSYLFLPNSSGYQWLLSTIMIDRMTSFKMADEIPVNLSTWYTYLLTWYTWVIPLRRRAAISTFGCRRLARVLLRLLRAGHSRGHSTNRPPCVKENMLLKISSAANIVSAPLFAQILGTKSCREIMVSKIIRYAHLFHGCTLTDSHKNTKSALSHNVNIPIMPYYIVFEFKLWNVKEYISILLRTISLAAASEVRLCVS